MRDKACYKQWWRQLLPKRRLLGTNHTPHLAGSHQGSRRPEVLRPVRPIRQPWLCCVRGGCGLRGLFGFGQGLSVLIRLVGLGGFCLVLCVWGVCGNAFCRCGYVFPTQSLLSRGVGGCCERVWIRGSSGVRGLVCCVWCSGGWSLGLVFGVLARLRVFGPGCPRVMNM